MNHPRAGRPGGAAAPTQGAGGWARALEFRGRLTLLALPGAAAVLFSVAWFGGAALRENAAEGRRVADALGELGLAVSEMNALEWQAVGNPGAETLFAIDEQRDAVEAAIERLERLERDDDEVHGVLLNYRLYEAAVREEIRLLGEGREAEAREVDEQAVDPAYQRFRESADEEARQHRGQARHEETLALRGTLALFGVALLGSIGLAAAVMRRTAAARAADRERDALSRSEARFRSLVQNSSDIVTVIDQVGRLQYVSPSTEAIMGYTPEELLGTNVFDLVHPEERASVVGELVRVFDRDGVVPGQYVMRMRHKDGSWHYIETAANNRLNDPSIGGIIHNSRDVTARKVAEMEQERLIAVISATSDVVIIADANGDVLHVNKACRTTLGLGDRQPEDLNTAVFLAPHEYQRIIHEAIPTAIRDGSWAGEAMVLHPSGEEFAAEMEILAHRDAEGRFAFFSCIARDVTERKRFESQLVYLANHDSLSGVFNRRRFEEELGRELARVRHSDTRSALLFIDIDSFKAVNDSLGHRAGDEMLRAVTRLLKANIGESDVLARIGGDEFAIILTDCDEAGAVRAAERIRSVIHGHRVLLAGQAVSTTASIGVACIPAHGQTVQELVMHADLAMYEAKETRDAWRLFSTGSDYQAGLTTRRVWEHRIRAALDGDDFVLHAQPVLGLQGQPISYELLLRMPGENGELVPPLEFLPIAERSGLIHLIDRWVIERTIELIAAHRAAGLDIAFSVNVSGKSLADQGLPGAVREALRRTGIDPSRLVIEITETAAIADIDDARAFIEPLRRMGVRFAIDDFGAGFASFTYLKHLPVDHVKIDGSFIRNLPRDSQDQHVVRAIVEVAHGLGKTTVAEFVEDQETLELLRSFGVDYAQGFHLGRPGPLGESVDMAARAA